jgi:hypothetical protein
MGEIEYRGTLVCSINVSDLDRSVSWYWVAEPNQPARASS